MSDSMSAIEYENMEQKYLETRSKLKKAQQYNERYNIQIQKLNRKLKRLENENKQLENQVKQLQNKTQDASESDSSSQTNLQQERTSMIDLVHTKNQQITDLLRDIEDLENENIMLKDKLGEAKEQLEMATKEITSMTETLREEEGRLKEQSDFIENFKTENERLKEQCAVFERENLEIKEQYLTLRDKFKENELKWKTTIENKEKQIEKLKSALQQHSEPSSSGSAAKDVSQIERDQHRVEEEKLKANLSEAECSLAILKSELHQCTIDLKESAQVIKKIKNEKDLLERKLEEQKEKERDIMQQARKGQERCLALQKEVEFANKLTKLFEADLSSIKDQIKANGQLELIINLEEIQSLNIEKLLHEKQIVGLVKDINKLQEVFNMLEIENKSLRSELGISSQDSVVIDAYILTESKRQSKLIEKLQLDIKKLNEERVRLKLEVKSLKKEVSVLSECHQDKHPDAGDKKVMFHDDDRSADIKALSEENEALRKGLHEILNSVQVRNETSPRELKSDVLERLLKALDVKHISGWYHPAMRMQAEIHTLEGVNNELREQLQEARHELDKLKFRATPETHTTHDVIEEPDYSSHGPNTNIIPLLDNNASIDTIKNNILKLFVSITDEGVDMESALKTDFEYIKKHVDLLHGNCHVEREQVLEQLKDFEKAVTELKSPSLETTLSADELKSLIITERKKTTYLLKLVSQSQDELAKTKSNFEATTRKQSLELHNLLGKILNLNMRSNLKNSGEVTRVDGGTFKELQNSLNEYIRKYRQLLTDVEEQQKRHEAEIEIFTQNERDLRKENAELKDTLSKTLSKSTQEMYRHDVNVLPLSESLAKMEIEALSQKNRADHTNNLYELVKEQLKKSEEKFLEFSKYGDGLLQKNMVFQERIAQLEDQLSVCAPLEIFKELEEKVNSLIKTDDELSKENEILQQKLLQNTESSIQGSVWTKEKEQELLGLKHEIIDLTATSDDKTVIDNLYCDLNKSRAEMRECQMQLEFLRKEVSNWEDRYAKVCSELESYRSHFDIQKKGFAKKIGVLQDLLLKQRIQFHGSIPLTLQEHYIEKLQVVFKEKILKRAVAQATESDLTNQEVDYLRQKLAKQERDIEKLEKELFSAYKLTEFHNNAAKPTQKRAPMLVKELVIQESVDPPLAKEDAPVESKVVILRNVESQTEPEAKSDSELIAAKIQLSSLQGQIAVKDDQISETIRLISEKEKTLTETRHQLKRAGDQIATLEKSLKDMGERTKVMGDGSHVGGGGDMGGTRNNFLNEQIMALQVSLKTAQDRIKQKDSEIIKYQTLLKDDRDKHSLAATNLQKELMVLRKAFAKEQQTSKSLEQECAISRQKSIAVEKYISQVRALESHLAELHTQLAQSKVQLENAHQEALRWRQMAQDRLIAMQDLGKSLNDQHHKELNSYKTDYEKLKELSEEEPLKRSHPVPGLIDPEVAKLCREKDQRIEELVTKLKQLESGEVEGNKNSASSPKVVPSVQSRELDILRTKYDALLSRERGLKEEIREMREQLSKRTNLSARSQKSERTIKEQLQKKINSLEREVDSLNEKLAEEKLINEKHRLSAHEDFDKWKKQKFWQESCQKYKVKLQEREEEFQKLQQTCTGYRLLIERLEREKINLENRIKALKSDYKTSVPSQEIASLKAENERLSCQLATLQAKMDIRQQGSGALSAAVMQEKLEAQERKIAILELSSKGSVEMRNELERLQNSLASLQKSNLCMEAENLELKLDLEKYSKETPRLHEQILHLESYIELLKTENEKQTVTNNDVPPVNETTEDKKVSQLERTVFVLKRVVEKLQVENKRLLSGKRPLSDRSPSAEKLRRDHLRLKDQYTESLQKIKDLEAQLQVAKKLQRKQSGNELVELLRSQLEEVKGQLAQKTQLLEKVKALLHSAAAREKQLLAEIADLKSPSNFEGDSQIDIPTTIEEVSEVSSDA